MGNALFPILGTTIPPMLGRVTIMKRLWSDLTKATPSNLSIIGPRYIGKTVIMNELSQRIKKGESPYTIALHWHLGHVAPTTDDEFITHLCNLLKDELASSDQDFAEHQEYLSNHSFEFFKEVTDALDSDGKPILMLWDGFDKPLGQGKLSGHLWDQMRTIFYGKKHKIVTATRKPLSQLIRSQDAITSPFWNIFDMNPVRIETFDEEDCEIILDGLHGIKFQKGAIAELFNWSAGFPPLFLEILNQITSEIPGKEITNEVVHSSAAKATEKLEGVISSLWDDCPERTKDIYRHLIVRGDLQVTEIGKDEQSCLGEKGFTRLSGNKLKASCRMLQQHVENTNPDAGSMARLFGDWDDYRSNIRALLERRLAHISLFDDRMCRLVGRAIEDIPDYPDDCLNNLTSIEERALDLIWQHEFGESKIIPKEIVDYWEQISPYDKIVQKLNGQDENKVPGDRGLQCGILQLLTGSRKGYELKAKSTTKDTYVLINALHSFRNRNQHAEGEEMHVGVAVAAIMACLEMLACLERELK